MEDRQVNIPQSITMLADAAAKWRVICKSWFTAMKWGTAAAILMLILGWPHESWLSLKGGLAVFAIVCLVVAAACLYVTAGFLDFLEQLANLPKTLGIAYDAISAGDGEADDNLMHRVKTLLFDVAPELDEIVDPHKLTPGYWSLVILAFIGSAAFAPALMCGTLLTIL